MTLENLLGLTLEKINPSPQQIIRLLNAARRNLADYSGDLIPDSVVRECLISANALLLKVEKWLADRKTAD